MIRIAEEKIKFCYVAMGYIGTWIRRNFRCGDKEKSNEETAQLLGMSMDNYYNKHKLAKEQFVTTLKKEGIC